MNGSAGLRRALGGAARTYRRRGVRGVLRRGASVALDRLAAQEPREPLWEEDIVHSRSLSLPEPAMPVPRGAPLRVGWVCTPPGPGSGGHTTMFRMVTALEDAGHSCVLFLYDRGGGDVARHEPVIRGGWPNVKASIRAATAGVFDVDVAIATSWESAHVLASRGRGAMRRAYFIQDYEPYFHPRGWEYTLAEDTYRFGFRNIALGHMVAGALLGELGVVADVVPFGIDTEIYHLTNRGTRSGVVFYARPGVDRRGYELGRLALQQFHRAFPDQPIHVFPSHAPSIDFPVIRHGRLSPIEINELYNSVVAGMALSFTNISLVAEEMLGAGAVPLINESPMARADLGNPYAEWVQSTPSAIAARLGELVQHGAPTASDVSATVVGRGWGGSQADLLRIVEQEGYDPTRDEHQLRGITG